MRELLRVCAALVALGGVACDGPANPTVPVPFGSRSRFESRVQPVVAERCASGGCHGQVTRPLALYAAGAYRRDPARTYLDEPLTPWEVGENMRRLSAFALGVSAADSLAVRKPLSVTRGGVWHGGGDVFADPQDPGLIALSGWLDARDADAGVP